MTRRTRSRACVVCSTAAAVGVLTASGLAPAALPVPLQVRATCGDARTPSSTPRSITAVGSTVYFSADDGVHGHALWRTDLMGGAPVRLTGAMDEGPRNLVALGDRLAFVADDGVHGVELWTSDGTPAGTTIVADLSDDDYEGPSGLVVMDDALFFEANGRLWRSDGTESGTVEVTPTEGGPTLTGVESLTAADDLLYFLTGDAEGGYDLWSSDGSSEGTVMVKRLAPSYDFVALLVPVGDSVFFNLHDATHGTELWTSDGTETGTTMVRDIRPGRYNSDPRYLSEVGGSLFFTARDGVHGRELWRSDGTESGTVMVKDIHPDVRRNSTTYIRGAGGLAFFIADDGVHGSELWRTDGTEGGTVRLTDTATEGAGSFYGLSSAAAAGDQLFFTGYGAAAGTQLWVSDGTSAGTSAIATITPGDSYDERYFEMAGAGDVLFLGADDGVHGTELWRSDGTSVGTGMVADVNRGGGFRAARRATHHPRRGSISVKVATEGAGHLRVAPAHRRLVQVVHVDVPEAGTPTVVLRPTRLGLRLLRRALRAAHRDGGQVGRLPVEVRFTFTPCGGEPSSQVRRYVLRLR